MGWVGQDIRYGLRTLARSPGFSVVALMILALGIGANTAIFSVCNALLLRELPARQPERLVALSPIYRNGSKVPFSFPLFEEIGRGQHVFSGLFGWSGLAAFNAEVDGALFPANVRTVTGNYFSELGATPLLGRLITADDPGPASQVAVLSYGFWDRRFGRDPSVVGRAIRIEGRPFTIIGVTREWFTGMVTGEPAEVTIPVRASPFNLASLSSLWLFVGGRLRDGVTMEQAQAQIQSFWPAALAATAPTEVAGERRDSFLSMRLELASAATGASGGPRARFAQPLYLLMGIAGLILLVVCVNVASLTLARAAAREHEMSTRAALGASSWRIVRQLLAESLLLSAAGAALALAFADWGSQLLVSLMTKGMPVPVVLDLRPDWRVFAFAALAAALTGVLIGLAPARQMARQAPAGVLRGHERATARSSRKLGQALIVAQIALSLMLLEGAGLLLRTLQRLRSFDPGFQKAGVLEVKLYARPGGYRNLDLNSYRKQLLERVAGSPGVLSAAFSNLPVLAGEMGWRDTVSLAETEAKPGAGVLATLAMVSPGFFQTLGIPLVSGRDFDWTDDEQHARVAILDGNLLRRLLPSGDVTRERVRFGVQPELQDLAVVGVARSARLIDARSPDSPVIYVPCLQHRAFGQQGNLLVRADQPAAVVRGVENEIRSLGREYSAGVKAVKQASERALLGERATAALASFFAALALLLAGIGLFGLMSYAVTRRTREIGIRAALGAQRGGILRMILGEALLLTLAGIVVGLPCALGAARLLRHMLFGVSPADPVTLAAVASTMLVAGVLAGYLPARRAMNMDPMAALRCE